MSEPATNLRSFPRETPPLQPKATAAATVRPEHVRWLSHGRIAAGKITVLDGDPGLGKSTITLDWAARITRGIPLPGEPGWVDALPTSRPRGVLLLSAEDGAGDTIVPRLMAANADLRRVILFSMADEEGNEYLPSLSQHLWAIQQQVEASDAALLIIDPLMAYLGSEVNANRDQDIRRVLSPLATMAEQTGCAVLVLRHLNKAIGMSSLYRGGGSIGIIGAARVGLLAGKDDRDATGQRRVLAVQKCNIGPEVSSLAYRVVSADEGEASRIDWLGETDLSAAQLTGQPTDETERTEATECEVWLRDQLNEGAKAATDIYRDGSKAGFSPRTLRTAKGRIGAKASKHGFGKDSAWSWYLPVDARTAPADADLTPNPRSASGDDPFDDVLPRPKDDKDAIKDDLKVTQR